MSRFARRMARSKSVDAVRWRAVRAQQLDPRTGLPRVGRPRPKVKKGGGR